MWTCVYVYVVLSTRVWSSLLVFSNALVLCIGLFMFRSFGGYRRTKKCMFKLMAEEYFVTAFFASILWFLYLLYVFFFAFGWLW